MQLAVYVDLCESSIATQVDDVSSAFGDLTERCLRDLSDSNLRSGRILASLSYSLMLVAR